MPPARPYLLFTDAPPLREGGFGCHVLSYNLLADLGGLFGMVVTRRLGQRIRRSNIFHAPGIPTLVYPDAPWCWPRRLRPWLELLLFTLSLPWLAVTARRSGCQRIFALFGADPFFLPKADLLRRATGLPLDVYLVDDFEEFCHLIARPELARLTRRVEPAVLRRAARVFVISPGYAEHLARKYGQPARWLPVPAQVSDVKYSPYRPGVPDQRPIVFVGSINLLYLDGLCELYQAMSRWNHDPGAPYELRLRILTRVEPHALLARLPDHRFLDVALDLDTPTLHEQLRAAWALFLPYSFDPEVRVMVSTSFSHKFTECVDAGRPILVYGPTHASIPRYFREENLPLCAQSPPELVQALRDIESHDAATLFGRYQALVRRYHSPDVLRGILVDDKQPS